MQESALDRARKLGEEATPGPWKRDAHYFVGQVSGGRPGGEVVGDCWPSVDRLRREFEASGQDRKNASFVTASRNAWPALMRAVDVLTRWTEREPWYREEESEPLKCEHCFNTEEQGHAEWCSFLEARAALADLDAAFKEES